MFDVALLIERALEPLDADQIIALHEGLDDTVRYHVLLPVESSAALLASSLGSLGGGQTIPVTQPEVFEEVQQEVTRAGQEDLDTTAALFTERGAQVTAHLTEDDPVDALASLVERTGSSEAIILTEPHLVREFFHVDWTSRAKRKLDVPTLHLLEHVPLEGQR